MSSMFRKANAALRGGSPEQGKKQDEEGESLTTILESAEDRAALTVLICDITEHMRRQLLDVFDPKGTDLEESPGPAKDESEEPPDGEGEKKLDDEAQKRRLEKIAEKKKVELAKREKEVSEEKMVALKKAALNFFDDWRDTVILRVGEVVNSKNAAKEQAESSRPSTANANDEPDRVEEVSQHDKEIDEALIQHYPPLETALRGYAKEKRILVLHSVLLLMLSLEHYKSHSRTLMLYLTTSLGLSVTLLSEDESKVARGLLEAAENMTADEETKKKVDENSTARRWKVGLAGVAGAALIGITGGLAAPLLAAGIGTVMGGIGLGATATAGYLGTLAGSSVLVGGLFGAYGGRMTSKVMDQYAREVEDFGFVPVNASERKLGRVKNDSRRLRVAIGISGWLSDKDDVVEPWHVVGGGQETFALRFELEALMKLGSALTTMITSAAWSVARTEIIKRTVFAALTAGLWPLALVKVSRVIDNPWSVANHRAQKAGEVLADALVNRAQGERPVTLVGYSLGAKVVYACLQQLAERRAFGLVENAVLLGTPAPCGSADWRRVRAVVTGRVVNAYSTRDYILAFLYRSSSIQYGVAGLQPVLHVPGVENVDVSDLVEGHTLYRNATGPILKRVGFEDVDAEELARATHALERQGREEQEKREAAAGKKKEDDKGETEGVGAEREQGDLTEGEVQKMEREVEQKAKSSYVDWMTTKLKVAGNAPQNAYQKARTSWRSNSDKSDRGEK
ncbi:hypothetical protein SLS62_003010 [Diatrype stigma]|uniref:DUF726-domain-containing protein n=1 Tax=Diatrype stigma TaxID=117547 RepID=A0AAN9YRQ2_9PEZI